MSIVKPVYTYRTGLHMAIHVTTPILYYMFWKQHICWWWKLASVIQGSTDLTLPQLQEIKVPEINMFQFSLNAFLLHWQLIKNKCYLTSKCYFKNVDPLSLQSKSFSHKLIISKMFLTVLNLGSNNNMREKFGDKDLTKISRENF